jgi:hypothetical protein
MSLKWLAGQQSANGNFNGEASRRVRPFKTDRQHETIFFTSLILACLENVDGSQSITGPALNFLKSQQSEIGSWNYWRRASDMAVAYPYPDDLDDTACALLALSIYEPAYVDGRQLAKLAKLLISSEVKPGGPYRTWLVEPTLYEKWGDVDLVVNANIGALLARHKVRLPWLEAFIGQRLVVGKLESTYYVGDVPSLYFLARWYQGEQCKLLAQRVGAALKLADRHANSLHLAMLLTAGCKLNLPVQALRPAQQRLTELRQFEHWSSEALYMDPTIDGVQYYAGSPALTTAFALEALAVFEAYQVKTLKSDKLVKSQPPKLAPNTLAPEMRRAYRQAVGAIVSRDSDGQIGRMANITAAAYGLSLDQTVADQLNAASLNGWVAYSLYDDFFDEEAEPPQLAIANYAMRQALQSYRRALPNNGAFEELVQQTYTLMDNANRWEVLNARASLDDGKLHYNLPVYGKNQKLAERSWGHMLAAVGVLLANGYDLNDAEIKHLQGFFHHFLIARQLNDDAHDWQLDLSRGHLSAVNCLLLKSYCPSGSLAVETEMNNLKLHFWQVTIIQVADLIDKHINLAERALARAGLRDEQQFGSWLQAIATATGQAVAARHDTQKFIQTYTAM